MVESWRRVEEKATEIGAYLEPSTGGIDPRRAYVILKHWYRNVSMRVPKPSHTDMEKVRGDLQTLYKREETHIPGIPLATHIDPAKVNDKIPTKAEVEAVVRRLRPHRAGGPTHLRAEPFKQWRSKVYPGKKLNTPTHTERWLCMVDIVQKMWRTGEIP